MKKKVVIFIDVVSHKNKLQIDAIINYGLIPHVFVATYKPSSDGYFINGGNQTLLITNGYKRIKQVNSYLQKNKNNIHHVEIYPGDRSAFFYLLLSKLYRIKCICVERGSLLVYQKNQGKATRFFMWLCYKFSDLIWYRELYMLPILKKINRRLYFLHNSIPMKEDQFNPDPSKKSITFLWLNRVIPQRRYDWFTEALKNDQFKQTENYLVGIVPGSHYKAEQQYVLENKPDNLVVEQYCNKPEDFYKKAKFFVLPAEIVFANHALLEAMSYGVVPLVSDQPGSELIVEDGKNGFIYNHNKKDFEETLLKALRLPDEDYQRLSFAAVEKIKTEFSEEKYKQGLKQLYELLNVTE